MLDQSEEGVLWLHPIFTIESFILDTTPSECATPRCHVNVSPLGLCTTDFLDSLYSLGHNSIIFWKSQFSSLPFSLGSPLDSCYPVSPSGYPLRHSYSELHASLVSHGGLAQKDTDWWALKWELGREWFIELLLTTPTPAILQFRLQWFPSYYWIFATKIFPCYGGKLIHLCCIRVVALHGKKCHQCPLVVHHLSKGTDAADMSEHPVNLWRKEYRKWKGVAFLFG